MGRSSPEKGRSDCDFRYQTIVWLDSIDAMLQGWIHLADTIYLNTNENDRKASWVPVRDYRYAQLMKERYPLHQYKRSARLLKDLRSIKTAEEVEVVQKAIDITDVTFPPLIGFYTTGCNGI